MCNRDKNVPILVVFIHKRRYVTFIKTSFYNLVSENYIKQIKKESKKGLDFEKKLCYHLGNETNSE